MDGQNEPRLLGIRFQLLPQAQDVCVNCSRAGVVLIAPDRIQLTVTSQRCGRMADAVFHLRVRLEKEYSWGLGASPLTSSEVGLEIVETRKNPNKSLLQDPGQH